MAIELEKILKEARDKEASDVHLKPGRPPVLRIHGKLYPQDHYPIIRPEDTEALIKKHLTPIKLRT